MDNEDVILYWVGFTDGSVHLLPAKDGNVDHRKEGYNCPCKPVEAYHGFVKYVYHSRVETEQIVAYESKTEDVNRN